jgi:hypothetical protein
MPELATWLKSRDAKFSTNGGVRAAEYIPLELLLEVQAMKDGDIKLVESGGRLQVIRLIASQAAPMDQTTAIPRIRQFLSNQRSIEAIAKEMKQLKEAARIELVSEGAKKVAAAELPAPNLDKGVRGLK